MKMEDQRISPENSCESIDPEFLTFRHNSPNLIQPSGRSIFSQRIDYPETTNSYCSYKSLDKYPFTQQNRQQRNFKKPAKDQYDSRKQKQRAGEANKERGSKRDEEKALRSFKSNEKKYEYGYRTGKNYVDSYASRQRGEIINQEQIYERKRGQQSIEDLNMKLSRLIKNIKREQRREIFHDKQISEVSAEIGENQAHIDEQNESICELEQICEENREECDKIINSIMSVRNKNEEMSAYLNQLDDEMDSSQISVQTIKQDSVRDRALSGKLKDGINKLNKVRQQLNERLNRLSGEVEEMYRFIKQNESLQLEAHNILYQ